MKKIKLQEKKVQFEYGDKAMTLRAPTVPEQFAFEDKITASKEDATKMYKTYREYMIGLGGDGDILDQLSLENFLVILEELGSKKN